MAITIVKDSHNSKKKKIIGDITLLTTSPFNTVGPLGPKIQLDPDSDIVITQK